MSVLALAIQDPLGVLFHSAPGEGERAGGRPFPCIQCGSNSAFALDSTRWSCAACGQRTTRFELEHAVLNDPDALRRLIDSRTGPVLA